MLKSSIIFLLLTLVIAAKSQQVNVANANLDRLQYKTGVMILYYGPNRLVKYCSLWDVKFKKEDNEEKIANSLKERVAASDPYMYFEFKEGFDCNAASGYLQQKGISKMSISSCVYINFSENSNGDVAQPGNGTAAWNNPDNVTPEYVNQLNTDAWVMVNRVMKKRMEQLEKDGWQRIYLEYNLAGGSKNLWLGKALSFSPDSMYKAIATVINSTYYLKLLNFDKPLVEGFPYQEYFMEYAGDSLGETISFQPTERINKIIAAAVSDDAANTNNAGIIVFRKKYSLQDQFQSVLDDAKNNFSNYKLDETKDPNGVTVFNATRVFGLKKQMIFQTEQSKEWMFSQFCNTDDPDAETLKKSITDIIESYIKTGNYLSESGEHEGDMVFRLIDKKENILFQMAVGSKKISLNFFGQMKESKQTTTATGTKAVDAIPFIDKNKNYLFKNWEEAKQKFSWNWLETSGDDQNVYRSLSNYADLNQNGNFPDSTILTIVQKATDFTWTITKPNVNKPVNYTLTADFSMWLQENTDGGQGLIIQYRDGKKGEPCRLYFLINPMKQTFWFGSQDPNKNEWTTHNNYTGNNYNIFSAVINKHAKNDRNTFTNNILSVKKETDRFLLYINNQLVDTVELNKKNDALRNFEGIGIVTVHKQSSAVEKISLSAD